MNVKLEEVKFILIEELLYGRLKIDGEIVIRFIFGDLLVGFLIYSYRYGGMGEDYFKFVVIVGEVRI